MTRSNTKQALDFLKQPHVKSGKLNAYKSTKIFGEKGGHTAFQTVNFDFVGGGANKSFEISKKTYQELKATGLFS